jgi:hypothetical protein
MMAQPMTQIEQNQTQMMAVQAPTFSGMFGLVRMAVKLERQGIPTE